MLFLKINRHNENLSTISKIYVQGCNVVYETANGSLDNIVEQFDTPELAEARYNSLQDVLIVQ